MRVLWIVLMVAGVVLLGLNALGHFYRLFLLRDLPEVFAMRLLPSLFWGSISLALAGVCGAGIFLKPGELRELTKEEPVKRATWLEELQVQDNSGNDSVKKP